MKYSINDSVREVFPDAEVSALILRFNDQSILAQAHNGLDAAVAASVRQLADAQPITSHPRIERWRTAFGMMGIKPSKFHSSIEALSRRAVRDGVPKTGIPFVDFYNSASVAQLAPMGAYDLAKVQDRHIQLRLANPKTDHFKPLGGDASRFPFNDQLVVYADDKEILCWGINVRDSESVCVDKSTKEAVLFCEAMDDIGTSPHETLDWVAQVASEMGAQCEPVLPS